MVKSHMMLPPTEVRTAVWGLLLSLAAVGVAVFLAVYLLLGVVERHTDWRGQ
jgi:hypothetical protein